MNHKKRGRPAPGHRDRRSAGPVRPPVKTSSRPAPERRHGPPEPQGSWIYGVHTVLAAIANPERVCLRLFLTPEAAESLKSRIAAIGRKGLPAPEILSRDALTSRLGADAVHQGIALLVGPPPERDLSDICRAASLKEKAAVVVLDQVEDPRNVGAVMRSAAAFGALGVIVTERHAPQQTATLAKAASGALETVPLVRVTNLVRALEELKEAGFWTAGFDMEGETTLDSADFAAKTALVLGAEGKGLRRLTREACDMLVRIPMAQPGASLNVSNAAAVALYALAAAHARRR